MSVNHMSRLQLLTNERLPFRGVQCRQILKDRQGHDRRKDCDIYVLCCYHLCWKFRAAQAGLADRTPHHHISVGLVEIVTDKCQCVS